MRINLRNSLTSLVLGTTIFSSCSPDNFCEEEKAYQKEKELSVIVKPITNRYPLVEEGIYKGMSYIILNKKIAEETRKNPFIEIRGINSEKSLKVNYNLDNSVKSIEGNLPYNEEAIRTIRENDTAFKSNFWIKSKDK